MEVPMAAEIKEGDTLKWVFPNGLHDECTITKVAHRGDNQISVYVDYIAPSNREPIAMYLRNVDLTWLTHYNGRRVGSDRSKTSRQKPRGTSRLVAEAEAGQISLNEGGAEMAASNTSTRKSLDDMSQAHRDHIEKWDPHLKLLRGEHVWAAVSRTPGRGVEGPVYVAVKRAAKDYAIMDYDTATKPKVTPKRVLADGFESSGALMEAFGEYRQMAKDERAAAKGTTKPKPKAKAKPTRKAAPKKARKPAKK
jgi:hypothetical protein